MLRSRAALEHCIENAWRGKTPDEQWCLLQNISWRYDVKKALVIIDVQNDYFPGGKMELDGSDKAGAKAGLLLETFRKLQLPVIHIQHVATQPGATFFLPDTEGVKIHNSVQPKNGEAVIVKHFPNSFRETALKKHLDASGITQLILAGMMSHMCVDTTVRAAFDLGYTCALAHDACATRALTFADTTVAAEQVHLSFMSALNGVFASVRSTEDIRKELLA